MDHSPVLLLFLLLATALFVPSPASADGLKEDDHVAEMKHMGSPVEWAIGATTAAFNSRWDAVRTRAKLAWLNLRSPGPSRSGSGVKEAAMRSFEASKETVEEAARSAAELAEEAVEKTKEKLKRTVSKPNPDAEF